MTTLVPERRRGNLPAEVTSFIGRRRELSQVREALERYRLVTLRGVGGVGKTRLALHLAADLQRSFADGVWLAELSALRNAELLARTVAASLGLPDQAAGDPVDLLADYLAERHLLLILDTCEHLVDACAKLAEALLPAAPRLRILATSREPLGVRGEQAQLISPLEVLMGWPNASTVCAAEGRRGGRQRGFTAREVRQLAAIFGVPSGQLTAQCANCGGHPPAGFACLACGAADHGGCGDRC